MQKAFLSIIIILWPYLMIAINDVTFRKNEQSWLETSKDRRQGNITLWYSVELKITLVNRKNYFLLNYRVVKLCFGSFFVF